MSFIPVLLFALSANIDCFILGISYGIRAVKFQFLQISLICLVMLCGTSGALLLGRALPSLYPSSYVKYAGSLFLLLLGIYYILKPWLLFLRQKKQTGKTIEKNICVQASSPDSKKEDKETNSCLTWKASLILGLSLSVNNLGIGIGASVTGLRIFQTSLMSLLVSALFLWLGNKAGRLRFFQRTGRGADVLCGLLLILLGICSLN